VAEFMPKDSTLAPLDRLLAQCRELAVVLQVDAGCLRWGLPVEAFAQGLRRSVGKRFSGVQTASPAEVEEYVRSLHLEDMALACACSEGIERAWEFFIARFREDLRRAAFAMFRASGQADDARAAELADSLYAELYGIRSGADGRRKSLFEYFHGRSKLSTWLRAVLAQRQVDSIRAGARTISLDSEMENATPPARPDGVESAGANRNHPAGPAPDPDRERYIARLDRALAAALAGLEPRGRLLLASYYVDQLTLAQIGRMLGEHESTISRQLERLRRALHDGVAEALCREIPASEGHPGEAALSAAQRDLAFEYALEDWPFDLTKALAVPGSEEAPRKT